MKDLKGYGHSICAIVQLRLNREKYNWYRSFSQKRASKMVKLVIVKCTFWTNDSKN